MVVVLRDDGDDAFVLGSMFLEVADDLAVRQKFPEGVMRDQFRHRRTGKRCLDGYHARHATVRVVVCEHILPNETSLAVRDYNRAGQVLSLDQRTKGFCRRWDSIQVIPEFGNDIHGMTLEGDGVPETFDGAPPVRNAGNKDHRCLACHDMAEVMHRRFMVDDHGECAAEHIPVINKPRLYLLIEGHVESIPRG